MEVDEVAAVVLVVVLGVAWPLANTTTDAVANTKKAANSARRRRTLTRRWCRAGDIGESVAVPSAQGCSLDVSREAEATLQLSIVASVKPRHRSSGPVLVASLGC
ncbi:MAG: hypothetical protein HKL86_03110 [Acidimicrobiaceae bacterium]|nr:hypothetical protein [Acidimicrobiaceae bacterium]